MQSYCLLPVLLAVAVTSVQGQSQSATSLSAAPATANMGQAVTLTAAVTPPTATGKITFYDGAAILGVAPVSNGSSSLIAISIGYGNRVLTARYSGDSHYAGSLSPSFAEHIVTQPGGTLVSGTGTANLDSKLIPAALADLNHDGNADLVATASNGNYAGAGTVWVFLGNADGTFQTGQSYLDGTSSYALAVADIDMDGNPDLLVTGPTGLTWLIGKGDGTFTPGSIILDATDLDVVRVADINADGKPDLLLLRSASPAVEILFGNGDGTFQTGTPVMLPLSSPARDLLVADFNGDGIPDLAVALPGANCVTIFLGTGPGTFGAPVAYTSNGAMTLNVGDFNNDGKLDLVVGGPYATFDLLLGNGDGTFGPAHSISTYEGPPPTLGTYPIAPYDFDGDGNADVVTSGLIVLLGNGDGTFRAPLEFFSLPFGGGSVVGDLNHDGIADIVGPGFPAAIQPWLGAVAPIFTLTASPNPPMLGQPVTLIVACNYLDASGTLTFEDIEDTGTPLGTAPLVNGGATLNLGPLATGPHIIHATYSGNGKYAPTVLPPLYLVAEQSIGPLQFTVSPNPALPGQPITMTAVVPIDVGNALIAFFDGTTLLNGQTLYSETATFTTTLSAGVHQLTALIPPYLGYLPASASVVENVIATPNGLIVPGPTYGLSSTITQAIALDLNGDGLPDLAVLDPGNRQVSVLLNNGQSVFLDPVAIPLGFVPGAIVATGFFSPYADFAVTDPSANAVYRYEYDSGQLAVVGNVQVGQQPVAIAAADFDGDGVIDLVTANAGSNNVSVILSSAINPVTLATGNHPDAIVAGDFNGDGKADFAVANQNDNDVMVFLGNGDGTFKPPVTASVGSSPIALVAGDLNGDLETDLVVLDGASDQATILLSNGDSTFRTFATYALGSAPSAAVLADMNGDNKLDLVVATASALLVLNGNGDGTFGAPVKYTQYAGAASVAAAPFMGDGRMDLAVTLPAANSVSFVVNGQPTTTSLSVSPSASTLSLEVTLKATVSPAGATGFAAFYDGTTPIGGAPVSNSMASFSTALLLPGVHSLSARFVSGLGYGPSSSGTVSLRVSPVPSSGLSGPTRQTFRVDSPINLIPGDFNNDGIEDFAFWRQGNGLRVLLGNGDGTFQEIPPGSSQGGSPAVTADFNNDGNMDIVYINGSLLLALGDGKGGFSESRLIGIGNSIGATDFNGDGKADFVLSDPNGTADVYLGIGNGTFQLPFYYPAGPNPLLVAPGDFNGDGKPDVVVVNYLPALPGLTDSEQVRVLPGKGDGSLEAALPPITISGAPVSIALADFNGDGHLDVAIVQSETNTASILLGKGDGTFASPMTFALGGTPAQVLAADMDGDGRPDLVVMFASAAPAFAVFRGLGDGTFAAPVNYSDIMAPSAMAVGDVNGDGRLDVVLAEGNTVNVFFGTSLGVTADFNGDGHPDLIWQDPNSGLAQVWYLVCPPCVPLAGAANLTLKNPWRIVGVADFDGNGTPDLVWQDPLSGAVQVWYMGGIGGNVVMSAANITNANPWKVVSVADFNRDGHPDLLWQDPQSGFAQIWYLGGPGGITLQGAANLDKTNPWHIVGTGDFNGDGFPDVVWQDPVSGMVQIWYMGGTTAGQIGSQLQTAINLTANSWHVVAIADFNQDGHPDVVFQNPANGAAQIFFYTGAMGTTLSGYAVISSGNPWYIAGPH